MNNQQTKTNRKTKKPYPLFTYFCLLLAVATMCTGVTFARYATSSQGVAGVGVVPLSCSFSVDEISSTAFSNSDYWITISDQQFAQNLPREVIFSLHNYQKNADGTNSAPSEIDLQSTFRICAPKELLQNVAFQILKKGDGNTRIPLTQQYILPQIIDKATAVDGTSEMSTSDFTMTRKKADNTIETIKPADYGEYLGREEETLHLSNQGFDSDAGTGKLVAVALTADATQVATIALTAEMRNDVTYETKQMRGYEVVVDGTQINDMSAPEYFVKRKTTAMVYYCLDITLPSMTMKATKSDGTFQLIDDQYVFAFTIIDRQNLTTTDAKVEEHFNVNGVSLFADPACTTLYKTATVKVVNTLGTDGTRTATKYFLVDGTTETEFTLSDKAVTLNGTTYYVDDTTASKLNNPPWNPSEEAEYVIGDVVSKEYSMDMRVLFTQASQTGGD